MSVSWVSMCCNNNEISAIMRGCVTVLYYEIGTQGCMYVCVCARASLRCYEVGAEDEAGVQGGHPGRQEGLQDTHCDL